MVFPVIGITVPEVATAAEVATLLESCDQAFLEGECRETPTGPAEPFELEATILWLNDTQARVTLARSSDAASDSEEVSFVAHDESIERYRSLGFAIGSLGSAFVSVPEEEAAASEPTPLLQAPEPELRAPADPPDPIPDAPSDGEPEPLPESLREVQVELGVLAGNGLANPRMGAELGLWVPIHRYWVSHWSFSYSGQPETSRGLSASFAAAGGSIGTRFVFDGALVAAGVGVQAQQLTAVLGEAELTRDQPSAGPLMALHARLSSGRFAPFASARVSYMPATRITLESTDASGNPVPQSIGDLGRHGPWQFDGLLGASFVLSP